MDIQNQLNSNQRTAEGVHTGHGMGLAGGEHRPDLLFKFPLAVQVRLGDQYALTFQNWFLQMQIL